MCGIVSGGGVVLLEVGEGAEDAPSSLVLAQPDRSGPDSGGVVDASPEIAVRWRAVDAAVVRRRPVWEGNSPGRVKHDGDRRRGRMAAILSATGWPDLVMTRRPRGLNERRMVHRLKEAGADGKDLGRSSPGRKGQSAYCPSDGGGRRSLGENVSRHTLFAELPRVTAIRTTARASSIEGRESTFALTASTL